MKQQTGRKGKLFILELDGGSWNVIEPLLSQGKLPVLRKLMDEGVSGILHSDHPPISPRIWTTIFTGKSSSRHGVEFFASTSSMVKQKRLWDIFNEKGLKVGVFGSLVTWPPYPVRGFMIPSILSVGPETYPDDYRVLQEVALNERRSLHKDDTPGRLKHLLNLKDSLGKLRSIGVLSGTFLAAIRYLAAEKILHYRPRDRYWRKAALYLKMTLDVFIHLYGRYQPDFATFHNHYTDAVSHRYWDCYEPHNFGHIPEKVIKRFSGIVPYTYVLNDKLLGSILSSLDPSTTVLIVSDHGMKALSSTVKPYIINFESFLNILGIKDRVIPARFGVESLFYFKDKTLKDDVSKTLNSISLSDTDEKIFDVVSKDEYLSVKLLPQFVRRDIPDNTKVRIDGFGSHPFSEIFTQHKYKISGIHHKEGIFIAWGPKIKKAPEFKEATVFDITPTALALMGFPVAEDMEGKVLTDIIDDDWLLKNPVRYIDTYEDGESPAGDKEEEMDIDKIKDRLSALGYL